MAKKAAKKAKKGKHCGCALLDVVETYQFFPFFSS